MGPAATPPRPRTTPQAALDAAARAAVCAGDQNDPQAPSGPRAASGRVWHPGGGAAGAGGLRLANQYRLRRAPQPQPAPAWGGDWASRLHAVQTRGGPTAAADVVSGL